MKKRTLFVDDQPGILNGLQRSLHRQCRRTGCLPLKYCKEADLFVRLLLMIVLCTAAPTQAEDRLILAIHPYLPSHELIKNFQPLADRLASSIGRPVDVDISTSYAAHIERVGKDEVHIAYMGPAEFVRLTEDHGEKPVLARLEIKGETSFRGHIVVRQQGPITALSDLKGKRFAFGDRSSTMSHFVPRYVLHQAGIDTSDLFQYKFLGSHNNVALSVLSGNFDAGAIKDEVFLKYRDRGLKVLASTPPIPTHVFIASPKLPPKLVQELRRVMLELDNDPDSRTILSAIRKNTTALRPASSTDFDMLRSIMATVETLVAAANGEE